MNYEVIHNKENKKFYCMIDGLESLMEYENSENNTLVFYHTYVPPLLRGKGIAEVLVKNAADFALNNGFKVNPTCSYTQSFFTRHKEYEILLK